MELLENKNKVFSEIEAYAKEYQRDFSDISILAVTKYVDAETASQLVATGISDIAENRVDKFLDKYHALKDENLTWHLIGTLQRRKVKDVINLVDYFHALDSLKLAQEINKRADHPIKCFIQVNVSGEESKHGFSISEIKEVLPEIAKLENIIVVGLMTMAPFEASEAECDAIFAKTNQLRQELKEQDFANMPMTELSMGMSRDVKPAIKNGATFVRIGSAFFQ